MLNKSEVLLAVAILTLSACDGSRTDESTPDRTQAEAPPADYERGPHGGRMLRDGDFAHRVSHPRYERYARDVAAQREALLALLHRLKVEGKTVAGYGAPAKGNTLLNYCGISTDLVPYTVDRNPMKIGLLTPGSHLPVLPVEALLDRQPDYLLILAWNFAGEIMAQQHEYRRRGGRCIIPIPMPQVL